MTRTVKMTLELTCTAPDEAHVMVSKVLTDVAKDILTAPEVAGGQVYMLIGHAPEFKRYGIDVNWMLNVKQERT